MIFKELIELYINEKDMLPYTQKNLKYKLDKIDKDLLYKDIKMFKKEDIKILLDKNLLKELKSIFGFAVKHNLIPDNPLAKDRLPNKSKSIKFINIEQIEALIQEFKSNKQDKDEKTISIMLLFQLLTGCRISEVMALRKKYINLEEICIFKFYPEAKAPGNGLF